MALRLFPRADDEIWCIEDVYSEHETNQMLAGNIAAAALLSDASNAINRYMNEVEERIDTLAMQPASTKDKRTWKSAARVCSVARIVHTFYQFTMYVAMLQMKAHSVDASQEESEALARVVERSRMTVSTFDTYLTINLDRSLQALKQYLQGKALKKMTSRPVR